MMGPGDMMNNWDTLRFLSSWLVRNDLHRADPCWSRCAGSFRHRLARAECWQFQAANLLKKPLTKTLKRYFTNSLKIYILKKSLNGGIISLFSICIY